MEPEAKLRDPYLDAEIDRLDKQGRTTGAQTRRDAQGNIGLEPEPAGTPPSINSEPIYGATQARAMLKMLGDNKTERQAELDAANRQATAQQDEKIKKLIGGQ